MSKTVRIGLGLLMLGLAGSFFVSELFVRSSGLWYFVIIASLVMMVVGVVTLWTEWGGKRK